MASRTPHMESEIRKQLDRILTSEPFRHSRRASAMLRFTVEKTLAGEGERIKERTIGVEVFGRAPSYDTSTDHVVRSTAGDVRRRLAQFYQQAGETCGLKIEFAAGSYVPQFQSGIATPEGSPFHRFWAPLFASGRPLLLSMGGPGLAPVLGGSGPGKPKDQLTLREAMMLESQKVPFSDAVTMAGVAAFLAAQDKAYRIALESELDLADLRQGPAILIGGLNNDWGVRLGEELRFTFGLDAASTTPQILDFGKTVWSIAADLPLAAVREDRGIVTRLMNQTTGHPMVMAAGLTMLGTLAAGDLLTKPGYLPEGDWDRPNAQLVFMTRVLRGAAGPPRVLDSYFW